VQLQGCPGLTSIGSVPYDGLIEDVSGKDEVAVHDDLDLWNYLVILVF